MGDYGFDFMKSSHHEQRHLTGVRWTYQPGSHRRKVTQDFSSTFLLWSTLFFNAMARGSGALGVGSSAFFKEPEKKTNAERHADVVEYLKRRTQSGKGPATITEISDATDVDLRKGRDDEVLEMLTANPKVEAVNEEDPLQETAFTYMAKYAVSNQHELLHLIDRCKGGICWEELQDTYATVSSDMVAMRETGRVIAIDNRETHKMNLYPRGDVFLTELPGKVRIEPGSAVAKTQEDMNQHIRRGEAVRLSGQWFRVSSETVGNQTQRTAAPPSVTMNADLKLRVTDTYAEAMGAPTEAEEDDRAVTIGRQMPAKDAAAMKLPFPVNGVFEGDGAFEGRAVRHGCCKALRELWKETRAMVPQDPAELHQVMFQKKLTTSRDVGTFKRPKRKVDDGSAKRERRRLKRLMKKQKTARSYKAVTNTHLENTVIGRLLQGDGGGGDRGGL